MLLITGFQPFAPFSDNPTKILVEELETAVFLAKAVLPVDFEETKSVYGQLLAEVQPRIILNLGLNAGASAVHLENFALNTGYDPQSNVSHARISDDAAAAYRTSLDTAALAKGLCEMGIPALTSNHAGTYLCNFVYYNSLQYVARNGGAALFAHLPFSSELVSRYCQTQGRSYPSLPMDFLRAAVLFLVERMYV